LSQTVTLPVLLPSLHHQASCQSQPRLQHQPHLTLILSLLLLWARPSLPSFLEPDETAYDLFARVVDDPTRTGISFLDQAIFLRPGHVVELVGPSGCGKSELLIQVQQHCIFTLVRLAVEWIEHMQAAASCILPKEVNGVLYGGREGTWLRCSTAKIAVKGLVDLLTIFSFVIQKTASC